MTFMTNSSRSHTRDEEVDLLDNRKCHLLGLNSEREQLFHV